jgi:membrane-bound ClpP family serine protease
MHELDILFKKLLTLDKNKNLNIFLKTYGGFSNVCNNICNELKQWKGKTSVYIKDFAYSAGTVIALSADKLYIGKNGKLSAINPMCSWFDKKYLCDFWASLLLPNPEKNDSDTINLINKKYKFDNIIKCMYVDVKKHATFYNLEEVTKIVGKNISISRKYKKILGYINKYYHSWTPTRSSIKYFFY